VRLGAVAGLLAVLGLLRLPVSGLATVLLLLTVTRLGRLLLTVSRLLAIAGLLTVTRLRLRLLPVSRLLTVAGLLARRGLLPIARLLAVTGLRWRLLLAIARLGRLLPVARLLTITGLRLRLLSVTRLAVLGLLARSLLLPVAGLLAVFGLLAIAGLLPVLRLLTVLRRLLLAVARLLLPVLRLLLAVLRGLLLPVVRLLTIGVVRPVANDRYIRVGLAIGAARVVMSVFGSPARRRVLAGIVLWIRRLSGAHRVTSLRVRMWHVSGHMPVLPNVST
jgi:hypothetical protein